MPVLWPDGGPWALATTSATVDWQPAAAALAAASAVRVAALVFGCDDPPGELLRGEVATFLQAADGSADPLSVDEAAALVRTLARTHGLVLVVGVPGLLVPVGRAGWSLMDLAVAVSAPVVVVTGTGPDSANHTSLALAAVSGHGLTGTVITVGGPETPGARATVVGPATVVVPATADADSTISPPENVDAARPDAVAATGAARPMDDLAPAGDAVAVDGPASEGDAAVSADAPASAADAVPAGDAVSAGVTVPGSDAVSAGDAAEAGGITSSVHAADHEAGMPVRPAGRIPGDVGIRGDSFAAAAREWLDPLLHASAGRPKADTAPPPPQPLPPPATASGKRVVLLLAGVFVSMSLVVCGLAFCDRTGSTETEARIFETTIEPLPPEAYPGTDLGPGPDPGLSTGTGTVPVPRRAVGDVCPRNPAGVTPTVPDRATTKRVNAAWKRIEVWLAAHAPASRRSLRPPAAAKEIAAAQRRMSVAFPADLVASLLRHDGVTSRGAAFTLPFFYDPLPVGGIVPEWLSLCEVLANVPGAQESTWWDKSFVPFASSGDGGNLLVDQRPGNHGRVGDFFNEVGVSFEAWPGSVAELLEKTAQSLESGRPYGNRFRPTVTREGILDWDIV
ncbi:SMI1/KNR4 family protein [Actinoplanes sp. ATCC 53533]|uniref:SMI1/KNR4 family protein n=1 Tax=Actinoplanes sp. ATCC 53533 TaxID=1288362 RepID=UPI000F784801|nr:SMI1/KNR4 family protein [Actinoplanes sp. ATCC 53533]